MGGQSLCAAVGFQEAMPRFVPEVDPRVGHHEGHVHAYRAGPFLLCLLVWAPPARPWQPFLRQSGLVQRVDQADCVVVVDQLARQGKRQRRVIHVSDDTPVVTARRPRPWDSYEEIRPSLLEILVGDFVLVESLEHDGRLVAQKITVVEPRTPFRLSR
jgi:hypothetical protein